MSDTDVEHLRNQLYDLAESIVLNYGNGHSGRDSSAAWTALAPDEREDVEERAAILESDAHMTRDAATRVAMSRNSNRRRQSGGGTH